VSEGSDDEYDRKKRNMDYYNETKKLTNEEK
jgi:hypothetical protein